MSDVPSDLLSRWDLMQARVDNVEDSERQHWFSEAAAFLQSIDHWWCQHTTLVEHFAEIFV